MDQLLTAIRDSPLSYLPEVSLSALCRFREGYGERCRMEGHPHDWQVRFNRFGPWVRRKFGMSSGSIELAEPVVRSFSSDERDAFIKYFELLDEFSRLGADEVEPPSEQKTALMESDSPVELFATLTQDPKHVWSAGDLMDSVRRASARPPLRKKPFIEIIRPDLFGERTQMHLPIRTFLGFCAFVMGDERAHQDLRLPPEDVRMAFVEFKRWVEAEKNRALPRPWFKIILYYSLYWDCTSCKGSAFSLFSDWLDEYAQSIGKPGLFGGLKHTGTQP